MRFVLTLLASAALAGAAAAQPPSPQPSARATALSHDIYEALGGSAQMAAMQDRMLMPLLASLPAVTVNGKDLRADMTAFIRAEMVKYAPQITSVTERVYAETFTEAQLQDILTFYRSPTGRAFAARLPEIGGRSAAAVTPVIRQVQADTFNHICDLKGCTPAERAQIAKLAGV